MSRPLRVKYPGALYHVMNRGLGRANIFFTDQDRYLFLSLLKQVYEQYWIEIHAYCLMNNHYHLLIKTPESNIDIAMAFLGSNFTRQINIRQNRDGPLFRGRYKAILVEQDAYLLNVSRYIHLNPVTANIAKKAEDYYWSSYNCYLSETTTPSWLTTKLTLNMIASKNQRAHYQWFVEEGIDSVTETFYSKNKLGPVFATDFYKEKLAALVSKHQEIPEAKAIHLRSNLSKIIHAVAEHYGIDKKILYQQSRGQRQSPKAIAIYLSRQLTLHSLNEIASAFKLGHYGSVSSVVRSIERQLKKDKSLRLAIDLICKKIMKN